MRCPRFFGILRRILRCFERRYIFFHKWVMRWYFIESPYDDVFYQRSLDFLCDAKFSFFNNAYIFGYFQNYLFVKSVSAELKEEFKLKKPLSQRNQELKSKILGTPDSVFLHVRRGDYLQLWNYIELGSTYYNNALHEINSRLSQPTVFIFSNDIAWCKQMFLSHLDCALQESMHFEFIEGNTEGYACEEMELMRSCKHAIIANSSFSWWAAYLIENPDKIVCMPKYVLHDPLCVPVFAKHLKYEGCVVVDHIWSS